MSDQENQNALMDSLPVQDDEKFHHLLLKILLCYCIAVTFCRLFGTEMRFIAYMDWTIYRNSLIARLPYYLAPFIGLSGLIWRRYRREGLFFVAGTSFIGIIDHGIAAFISIMWRLPFFRLRGSDPPVRITMLVATCLAVVFTITAIYLFQLSKRLHKQMKTKSDRTVIPVLLLLFCYISPFVSYGDIVDKTIATLRPLKGARLYSVGSMIRHMSPSPDGKLLALAAEKGFYVWDVAKRNFVFSDDIVSAQRTRFSKSGKHLAVVGNGVPEGNSDIIVYETDGFKRLNTVHMPPEEFRRRRVFNDVIFRSDDKSISTVWERRWIEERLSEKERNIEKGRQSGPFRQTSLYCVEYDLMTGKEICNVKIEEVYEFLIESAHFIPNSTELLLFRGRKTDKEWIHDTVVLRDVTSGKESIVQINGLHEATGEKNLRVIFIGNDYTDRYIEWRATQNGEKFYFVQQLPSRYTLGVTDRQSLWENCYVQKREGKLMTSGSTVAWSHLALSPDDKFAALVGFHEAFKQYGRGVATVRIVNLETAASYLIVRKIANKKDFAWLIEWLDADTVAVSRKSREGEFFFVNVSEEGK
jgi:hypothetical protein